MRHALPYLALAIALPVFCFWMFTTAVLGPWEAKMQMWGAHSLVLVPVFVCYAFYGGWAAAKAGKGGDQ